MNSSQRAVVSFTDVAASFTEEEWDILEEWQRDLYGNVMREIHNVLLDLGYRIENSEVLFRIISEDEPSKRGHSQEGSGPDIMLRINYQGPGATSSDPEDSGEVSRIIKTESDFLPNTKQEDVCDAGLPCMSQEQDNTQFPIPGPVPGSPYSTTVKKESEDVADTQAAAGETNAEWRPIKTRLLPKSPSRRDTPEPPCRERTRRRKGIARQIKPVAALHDSDLNKQTEPKETEGPRHPRVFAECESSFAGVKLPFPATHQGDEVYPYSAFAKGFREDAPISFHQRGQTFIICSVCGKTFCNNSSFQVHMRTHTGERPYKCTDCEKSFIRTSHLKIHLRTHTGERPYKCSECEKSFRDNSSFARHQRIHTGEKPYQCSTCGKYFRKKSNLKDHQRTHTGERPYKCKHCDKSFHQKSNLRVHERNHHADDS